jgi:hypothetical protein
MYVGLMTTGTGQTCLSMDRVRLSAAPRMHAYVLERLSHNPRSHASELVPLAESWRFSRRSVGLARSVTFSATAIPAMRRFRWCRSGERGWLLFVHAGLGNRTRVVQHRGLKIEDHLAGVTAVVVEPNVMQSSEGRHCARGYQVHVHLHCQRRDAQRSLRATLQPKWQLGSSAAGWLECGVVGERHHNLSQPRHRARLQATFNAPPPQRKSVHAGASERDVGER